jgi:hypothetical protein
MVRRTAAAAETIRRFERHVPGIDYDVLDELTGYAIRRAQLATLVVFERWSCSSAWSGAPSSPRSASARW